jgi:hypothetical protein
VDRSGLGVTSGTVSEFIGQIGKTRNNDSRVFRPKFESGISRNNTGIVNMTSKYETELEA